jgi:hypothetical protein
MPTVIGDPNAQTNSLLPLWLRSILAGADVMPQTAMFSGGVAGAAKALGNVPGKLANIPKSAIDSSANPLKILFGGGKPPSGPVNPMRLLGEGATGGALPRTMPSGPLQSAAKNPALLKAVGNGRTPAAQAATNAATNVGTRAAVQAGGKVAGKPNALLQAIKNHPFKTAGIGGTAGLGTAALLNRRGKAEQPPVAPGIPGMGMGRPRMGMEGPPQSSGPDFASLDQLINQLNGPGQPQPQQNPLAATQQNPLQSAVNPQQDKGFDWMKMLQVVGPLLAAVLASRAGK